MLPNDVKLDIHLEQRSDAERRAHGGHEPVDEPRTGSTSPGDAVRVVDFDALDDRIASEGRLPGMEKGFRRASCESVLQGLILHLRILRWKQHLDQLLGVSTEVDVVHLNDLVGRFGPDDQLRDLHPTPN